MEVIDFEVEVEVEAEEEIGVEKEGTEKEEIEIEIGEIEIGKGTEKEEGLETGGDPGQGAEVVIGKGKLLNVIFPVFLKDTFFHLC